MRSCAYQGYGVGPPLGAMGSDLPNQWKLLESSTDKVCFKGLNRLFQARIDATKHWNWFHRCCTSIIQDNCRRQTAACLHCASITSSRASCAASSSSLARITLNAGRSTTRGVCGSDLPNQRKLLESSADKVCFKGLNRLFQARIDATKHWNWFHRCCTSTIQDNCRRQTAACLHCASIASSRASCAASSSSLARITLNAGRSTDKGRRRDVPVPFFESADDSSDRLTCPPVMAR